MTIQPISAASTVLYLTPADLLEQGLRVEELTPQQILNLTRDALCQTWVFPSAPPELEVYPAECGLLIFIHLGSEIWLFRDFEALLTATLALDHDHTDCRVFWWNEAYWLILSGQNTKGNALLSEFGSSASDIPYISSRLEESGTLLLDQHTLPAFCRCFRDKKRELP